MSTLRKDPVSNGWVIIAEERGARPSDFAGEAPPPRKGGSCPFCGGNEAKTPPEIFAFRKDGSLPNTPGWSVRTISNKYAALHIEGELDRRGEGIYDLMTGVGAHEVIVETPQHDAHMGYYSRDKMEDVLLMYIQRYQDLFKDKRFRYIQIFRNYGQGAGASLEHPHSQLIALPITPRWVKEELHCALNYYRLKERCLFCDIVNQETRDRQRVVFENDSFVTIEPFASKFPFETWLFPKEHNHDFSLTTERQIADLAQALQRTLYAIAKCLNDPPLNYIIHSAPHLSEFDLPVSDITVDMDYHWHIEIFPRVTRMAGFEWGTGFYINPMTPESAAEELRRVFGLYTSQIRVAGPTFYQQPKTAPPQ
jgi:UDPglucose--hexose-1-phosphate uridylyltransferase